MFRAAAALFLVPALLPSCVTMPDPPPRPEDLSALAAQYDHPSAVLPIELVQRLVEEGLRRAELAEVINRLRFVRTVVSETNSGLGTRTNSVDLELQGRVDATVPCPGDGPVPTMDGDANGLLRLTLGVQDSRLRRGFQGAAERCRVLVASPGVPERRALLSATVVGDLGADLGIGNTMPGDILMKLRDVSGTVVSSAGTVDLAEHEYHFRLTQSDLLEVLLDPASFGLPDLGSVVLAAGADGSLALRESRGAWTCGGGGEACVLR